MQENPIILATFTKIPEYTLIVYIGGILQHLIYMLTLRNSDYSCSQCLLAFINTILF
jgi:hypothetical protein